MKIKKAITFCASSIGDALMAKYLLENIHAKFPDARLGIAVAGRGEMLRDLFAAYPWIEVVVANRRNLRSLWRLLRDWRGSDLATTQVAMKNGGAFGLASKLAARLLARRGGLFGFKDSSRLNRLLYDRLLPIRNDVSVIEYEREILRAAGIDVSFKYPSFIFNTSTKALERFNITPGQYVFVHMFAGNDSRGISPHNRRALLAELRERLPSDFVLVISGGAGDRVAAEYATRGMRSTIVIAGNTTLQETANLISNSLGVISICTGVGHIAAHLRKPIIILRTCMGKQWWVPSQYGAEIPSAIFTREDFCIKGHKKMDFPHCLNEINMSEVAIVANNIFVSNTAHVAV